MKINRRIYVGAYRRFACSSPVQFKHSEILDPLVECECFVTMAKDLPSRTRSRSSPPVHRFQRRRVYRCRNLRLGSPIERGAFQRSHGNRRSVPGRRDGRSHALSASEIVRSRAAREEGLLNNESARIPGIRMRAPKGISPSTCSASHRFAELLLWILPPIQH